MLVLQRFLFLPDRFRRGVCKRGKKKLILLQLYAERGEEAGIILYHCPNGHLITPARVP